MSAAERDLLDRLNVRYGKADAAGIGFARAEHVKLTAGWNSRRVLDYMAFDLRAGLGDDAGPTLHGHEVKATRSDWLAELRQPEKAESFARFCDYFWLVAANRSIVKDGELPNGWGLMVAHGTSVRVATPAVRRRDVDPLPRSLQATLARAVTKTAVRIAATRPNDPAVTFLTRQMRLRSL